MALAAPRHVEMLERDADAEIDRRLAHQAAEIGIGVVRVASLVADHDEAAPPAQHLVGAEISKCPPSDR